VSEIFTLKNSWTSIVTLLSVPIANFPSHLLELWKKFDEYERANGSIGSKNILKFSLLCGFGVGYAFFGPIAITKMLYSIIWGAGAYGIATLSGAPNAPNAANTTQTPSFSNTTYAGTNTTQDETAQWKTVFPGGPLKSPLDAQRYATELSNSLDSAEADLRDGKTLNVEGAKRKLAALRSLRDAFVQDYGDLSLPLQAREAIMSATSAFAIPETKLGEMNERLKVQQNSLASAKNSFEVLQDLHTKTAGLVDQLTSVTDPLLTQPSNDVYSIAIRARLAQDCFNWSEECTDKATKILDESLKSYPPKYTMQDNFVYRNDAKLAGIASLEDIYTKREITAGPSTNPNAALINVVNTPNLDYVVCVPQTMSSANQNFDSDCINVRLEYKDAVDVIGPPPRLTLSGNRTLIDNFLGDVSATNDTNELREKILTYEKINIIDNGDSSQIQKVIVVDNPPDFLVKHLVPELPVTQPAELQVPELSDEERASLKKIFDSTSPLVNLDDNGKIALQKTALRLMGESPTDTDIRLAVASSYLRGSLDQSSKFKNQWLQERNAESVSLRAQIDKMQAKINNATATLQNSANMFKEILSKKHVYTDAAFASSKDGKAVHLISKRSFDLLKKIALGMLKTDYAAAFTRDREFPDPEAIQNSFKESYMASSQEKLDELWSKWNFAGGADLLKEDLEKIEVMLHAETLAVKPGVDEETWKRLNNPSMFQEFRQMNNDMRKMYAEFTCRASLFGVTNEGVNFTTKEFSRQLNEDDNSVESKVNLFSSFGIVYRRFHSILNPERAAVKVNAKPNNYDERSKMLKNIENLRQRKLYLDDKGDQKRTLAESEELIQVTADIQKFEEIKDEQKIQDIIYESNLELYNNYETILKKDDQILDRIVTRRIDLFRNTLTFSSRITRDLSVQRLVSSWAALSGTAVMGFDISTLLAYVPGFAAIAEASLFTQLSAAVGVAAVLFIMYKCLSKSALLVSSGARLVTRISSTITDIINSYLTVRGYYNFFSSLWDFGLDTAAYVRHGFNDSTHFRDLANNFVPDEYKAPPNAEQRDRIATRAIFWNSLRFSKWKWFNYLFNPERVVAESMDLRNLNPDRQINEMYAKLKTYFMEKFNFDVSDMAGNSALQQPGNATATLNSTLNYNAYEKYKASLEEAEKIIIDVNANLKSATETATKEASKAAGFFNPIRARIGADNAQKGTGSPRWSTGNGFINNNTCPAECPAGPIPESYISPLYSRLFGAGIVVISPLLLQKAWNTWKTSSIKAQKVSLDDTIGQKQNKDRSAMEKAIQSAKARQPPKKFNLLFQRQRKVKQMDLNPLMKKNSTLMFNMKNGIPCLSNNKRLLRTKNRVDE
jgi:hypothetical protein